MQYFAFIDPVLLMAALLAALLAALIALEIYNGRRVQKLAYPAYEFALKDAQKEADHIIEEARQEARQLVEKAEAESVSLVGAHKSQDEAASKQYEEALKAMLSRLETQLSTSAKAAEEASVKARTEIVSQLQGQEKEAATRLAASYGALEKEASTRINEQVAQAFAAASKEAQEYERTRKQAIDTHIVALVGDVMKIALKKTLPPEAHAELVRQALEEAKADHIF